MAEGKLALITGAGGGMGQATVARLSRDGFRIAGTDINEKGLDTAITSATLRNSRMNARRTETTRLAIHARFNTRTGSSRVHVVAIIQ